MSDTKSVNYVDIHPSSGKIQDVRFVDDENIMLAVVGECKYLQVLYNRKRKADRVYKASSHLINIQYRQSDGAEGLHFADYGVNREGDADSPPHIQSFDLEQAGPYLRHSFPKDPSWTPERMDINGRQGKRALCVLSQDALHYRVYDLDPPRIYEREAMEVAKSWSLTEEEEKANNIGWDKYRRDRGQPTMEEAALQERQSQSHVSPSD